MLPISSSQCLLGNFNRYLASLFVFTHGEVRVRKNIVTKKGAGYLRYLSRTYLWNDWPTILILKMECGSQRCFLDLMMCTSLLTEGWDFTRRDYYSKPSLKLG